MSAGILSVSWVTNVFERPPLRPFEGQGMKLDRVTRIS